MRKFYLYILTNKRNNVLYVGVTSSLVGRIRQHKKSEVDGFTKKYNVKKLVYYEEYDNVYDTINREKQLKNWKRKWKVDLIKKNNPELIDLSSGWYY